MWQRIIVHVRGGIKLREVSTAEAVYILFAWLEQKKSREVKEKQRNEILWNDDLRIQQYKNATKINYNCSCIVKITW